jgi:hypothetical protein
LNHFAEWLSTTATSVYVQVHNAWMIPAIQSLHITGIGLVLGAVFLIFLRILGLAGMDQTLRQTVDRFGPWLNGSLWLLLATGALLIIGEPVRELVTFSFWLKMFLVALSAIVATVFQSSVRKHERKWEETLVHRNSIRWLSILTFVIWISIIVLGRLIAYDHVWGAWSPATKA